MNTNLSWEVLQRFKLIELTAYWEGRLTTNHLCYYFGIGRQQASRDINRYLNEFSAKNICYDKTVKGYIPNETFKPVFITLSVDEYLNFLRLSEGNSDWVSKVTTIGNNIFEMQPPARVISPTILRTIVMAIKQALKIRVRYLSMNTPQGKIIHLSPHKLVSTGIRWHVRAFSDEHNEFRDFVINRISEEITVTGNAIQSEENDDLWKALATINIAPDPRLTKEQKKIIALDYAMTRNILKIESRGALVTYYLQMLGIQNENLRDDPRSQQIVLANRSALKKYCF